MVLWGFKKKEFHNRIGGKWDITDDSKVLGIWYRDCYMRRNRIIHGGYNPNHNDASLAIGSADNLIGTILNLTSLKKKKYSTVFEYIKK